MKISRDALVWFILLSLFTFHPPSLLLAQPPTIINYQGRLVDGTNLVNGNIELSLRLFNASSGGDLLYEDSNTVAVVDGLYSTYIGDHPTNVLFIAAMTNDSVWVEVAVNGVTLTPREQLASVAYSLATRGMHVSTNGSIVMNPEGGNIILSPDNRAVIGGGSGNTIRRNSSRSVIAGGGSNLIATNSGDAVIGGGFGNRIEANSFSAAIAGGDDNFIGQRSQYSFIGGGAKHRILTNVVLSAILGGAFNEIWENSHRSVILGGEQNYIFTNSPGSVHAAGSGFIGPNAPYSFIAGAGAHAQHANTFVWSDGQVFRSTGPGQFLIRASGNVGINMTNPVKTLHVNGDIQIGRVGVWSTTNDDRIINFGDANFCYIGERGADDRMELRAGNVNSAGKGFHFSVGNLGLGVIPTTNIIHTAGGAFCSGNGTAWVNSSDKNAKDGFQAVDVAGILDRVASLPISTWHYKSESADLQHIGPMAQDFHAAFGVGYDDKSISTVDASGVALAAIQALAKENAQLREELEAIKRKLGM